MFRTRRILNGDWFLLPRTQFPPEDTLDQGILSRSYLRRRRRRGVVLLIVVACIVIAGLAMVGVTRQSLQLATASLESESELQQRWGTISLQRTLLHSAPKIFADLDKRSLATGNAGPFPCTVGSKILLGGMKYDVLLADEQAKLNLNFAYHARGKNIAELLARKMKGRGELRVRMMPEVASAAPSSHTVGRRDAAERADDEPDMPPPPAAFRHWGQVFDLAYSRGGRVASPLLPLATSRITCWGRGEVNITRAPNDVIEETCRAVLGPGVARKLVSQYRENPTLNVQQIARQLDVDSQELRALGQLLTTQSSTYSLWLTSASLHGTQRWFAVASPSDEVGITTQRFQF